MKTLIEAEKYFDAYGRWLQKHHKTLKTLHAAFERESASTIGFSEFCWSMFGETKQGLAGDAVQTPGR